MTNANYSQPLSRRVAISFPYEETYKWHLDHTAPDRRHRWNNVDFVYNPPEHEECDAWVVWQSHKGLRKTETRTCPPNKTILVTREPPDILELPREYLRQFALILAPDARMQWHKGHCFSQFGQNWHVEKDYGELIEMPPPSKPRHLSTVVSAKVATEGQKRRFEFAEKLKGHFKTDLDWFGRGVKEISNKWDAIAPYRYHIVMENGAWPHYWTEKLADAYLGWSMPIYVGAPNILEYFDERSLIIVDPDRPSEAISAIRAAIEEDRWQESLEWIRDARARVLSEYHLYGTLCNLLFSNPSEKKQQISLKPAFECKFSWPTRIRWAIRNATRRLGRESTRP
ncbi:MAG: glycosyltransferase family 10 [Planctomycetaceae bacterium]|nr:glycosyltransferase family 10 [Planctomycetaceae bacterium]